MSDHFFQGAISSTCAPCSQSTTECYTPSASEISDNMLLPKSVVKSLNTDANPDRFHLWSASFLAFIQKLRCSASIVLSATDDEWIANLSDDTHGQSWLELDSLMSTTIFACLDTAAASKHVEVLTQRLKRTNGLQSGRAIWRSLHDAANPTSGPRKREHEKRIGQKSYFTAQSTAVDIELSMEHLLTDWASTSEGRLADPILFIKHVCTKLPSSIAVKSEEIERVAFESEACTQRLPWTFRELTDIVSIALRAASKSTAAAAEAAAFWAQKQKGSEPPPDDTSKTGAFAGPKKCPLCSSTEHAYAKCKRNCSTCNCKSCPASMRTGKCVLETKSVDPKLKNANGKPVPPYIIQKLQGIVDSGVPQKGRLVS